MTIKMKIFLPVLCVASVASGLYFALQPRKHNPSGGKHSINGNDHKRQMQAGAGTEQQTRIAANRQPQDRDGFRGQVHPLLYGKTSLKTEARWSFPATVPHKLQQNAPQLVDLLLRNVRPAESEHVYTEQDLSAFLPQRLSSVGEVWTIDPRIVVFLKQLHPSASLHLQAMGLQAGPDGAFGILRGMSPSFLDILCRIHCEFTVTPTDPQGAALPGTLRYTPAYMLGRLIINRTTGTVDYFRLGLPTDRAVNVHLTSTVPLYGDFHDIVRVDHLELEGGNRSLTEQIQWDQSIETLKAKAALAHRFYKFTDIAWVPFADALATARALRKPIFAVVAWGPLEDQSC
jgi:hypothetical protein